VFPYKPSRSLLSRAGRGAPPSLLELELVGHETRSLAAKLYVSLVAVMDPELSPVADLIQSVPERARALMGYELLVLMPASIIEMSSRRCSEARLRAIVNGLDFGFFLFLSSLFKTERKDFEQLDGEAHLEYRADTLDRYRRLFRRKKVVWSWVWLLLNVARELVGEGHINKRAVMFSTALNAKINASGLSVGRDIIDSIAIAIESELRKEIEGFFQSLPREGSMKDMDLDSMLIRVDGDEKE
jgi:hypothetical protein